MLIRSSAANPEVRNGGALAVVLLLALLTIVFVACVVSAARMRVELTDFGRSFASQLIPRPPQQGSPRHVIPSAPPPSRSAE